jgi:hypothetical protein
MARTISRCPSALLIGGRVARIPVTVETSDGRDPQFVFPVACSEAVGRSVSGSISP